MSTVSETKDMNQAAGKDARPNTTTEPSKAVNFKAKSSSSILTTLSSTDSGQLGPGKSKNNSKAKKRPLNRSSLKEKVPLGSSLSQ